MRNVLTLIVAGILLSAFSSDEGSEVKTLNAEGLDDRQQQVVVIAANTANGNQAKLARALSRGLDAGLTVNEIKEILVQMYAYAGFPRSLNGISTFMDVLEERAKNGVRDEIGNDPTPLPTDKSSLEIGTENLIKLTGAPSTGRSGTFCPAIDAFLKGHLFGDIFGRDNVDFQTREIATISALATLGDVNPQLQSHFNVGFNTGLTEAQMTSLISVIRAKVGRRQAANASKIMTSVISKRHTRPEAAAISATQTSALGAQMISITRRGAQPVQNVPTQHFTGSAQVQPLFQAHRPAHASGASVTFEPGARTAWHSHPLGQTLVVTAGVGWIQQWRGQIQEIREGDVVWIPPGVKHWHGATRTTSMTHLAIQEQFDGETVQWMEKVSDDQYQAMEQRHRQK